MTEGSTSLPIAGLSTIAVGGGGGCGIGCVVDWRMSMEGRLVSFVGMAGGGVGMVLFHRLQCFLPLISAD